jgi:poly-beta-1,6-N-acetyl-D-glucosamine synthase
MSKLKYVLITPARNEEKFIEQTIRSVICQSLRPESWIIVSDGSTDRTDEIVTQYLAQHPWIVLVRMPEHRDRQFAAKVRCFNAGYDQLGDLEFEILGNLDADITFDTDYFDFLMGKFDNDPQLGVAGTPFVEGNTSYDYRFTDIQHVSGACQMFRRSCFDDIGGYQPIKGGGIDWVAVVTARMKNWRTRTFTEKVCYHNRPMGTENSTALAASFKRGKKDYFLGGHPLWQVFRVCYQMRRSPFFVGGLCLGLGFFWAYVTRVKRQVSPELMRFHQREQLQRLRQMVLLVLKKLHR